jgi:TRAP-type mannitol/chloroaromatic compound transport system substrate-binding protein
LCENVKVASGGRFIITPYPAGGIAAGAGIWDAVVTGVADMGQTWTCWWQGKDPGWIAMQGIPWMFESITQSQMWWYEGEGNKIANDFTNPHGLYYRPAWWLGWDVGMMTNFPADGLSDFHGRRFRSCPALYRFTEAAVEAAGYKCTFDPVPGPEIMESLMRGLLDAVEWTVASALWENKWWEFGDTLLVPGIWGGPAQLGDFIINIKAYDKLPPDLQGILELAMREFAMDQTLSGQMWDIEVWPLINEKLRVVPWSAEDMEYWKEGTKAVHEKEYAENPMYKRVYDSKLAFKKKFADFYSTHDGKYAIEHGFAEAAYDPTK